MIKIVYCKYFDLIIYDLCKVLNNSMVVSVIDIFDTDMYIFLNIKDHIHLPKHYIVYNFEQLTANTTLSETFWINIKNAYRIIDYSELNIRELSKRGLHATFLPFSWLFGMKTVKVIQPFCNRQNTILFIGSINTRRRNILKPVHTLCKQHDYGLFLSNDCWDSYHTRIMSLTKIALNIHYYEGNTILEVHRIIQYVMNKIIVISERSNDKYYDDMMDGLVTWSDKDMFEDKITEILSIPSDTIEELLSHRQRDLLNKKSMSSLFIDSLTLFKK